MLSSPSFPAPFLFSFKNCCKVVGRCDGQALLSQVLVAGAAFGTCYEFVTSSLSQEMRPFPLPTSKMVDIPRELMCLVT